MPFPEPETALPAMIDPQTEECFIRSKTAPPAACQGPSATFQRLTRRLNDLQKMTRADSWERGVREEAARVEARAQSTASIPAPPAGGDAARRARRPRSKPRAVPGPVRGRKHCGSAETTRTRLLPTA